MAQPYSKAVTTQNGLALIARALAGDCHIVFTRVGVGDGWPEDLENLTSLVSEKASYPIYSISYHTDTCVRLRTLISNWNTETQEPIVTESFYMNEIGVFAMGSDDGVEILYSVAVTEAEDHGDIMPAYDSTNPTMIQQDFYVDVDNAMNVTVQVPNDLYLLADDALYVHYDADTETLVFTSGNYATGGGSSEYVLPVATETRLGGIKIGDGLRVATDGTASVDFSQIPNDVVVSSAIVESGTEEMTQDEVDEAYDDAKQ